MPKKTTPTGPHTDLATALAAFETALKDVTEDNLDISEDDAAYDLVFSVAYDCTEEVAKELARVELGWIPEGLRWTQALDYSDGYKSFNKDMTDRTESRGWDV